jgi:Flp pilus assembly CpaE family ATPase
MYPLNLLLVNCRNDVLREVRKELAKLPVTVEVEFSSPASVISSLPSWQDHPRLFLFAVTRGEDLPYLKRLHDAYPGWPILVLPTLKADLNLIMQLMRDGASQIVPVPIISEDFQAAMQRIGVQHGFSTKASRLIVISSVSGASGASTLSVNLASEIATLRKVPTILFEASLRVGVVHSMLDFEPRYTTSDLFSKVDQLDLEMVKGALTKIGDNLYILPGPQRMTTSLRVSPADMLQMFNYLRYLGKVVIVDLPCTFDDYYFDMLAGADQVVLLGEQTVPSVRSLKMIHLSLVHDQRQRLRDLVKHVVINRYDPRVKGFDIARLREVLDVPSVMTIADDPNVRAAVNSGRPLRQEAPKSAALADVDKLADVLVPPEDGQKKRVRSTLSRVLSVFGKK